MAVNGDEEPFVELKGTGELLHELPHALQQLINNGRYLFGVTHQMVTSGEEVKTVSSKHKI